jgi:hypothetical protein
MKLVTRAQWGAREYRRPNGAISYSRKRRGVKLHYLGTPYPDRPHTRCAAYVRRIQTIHMDERLWSDIGYSFVVCTHGWVYEGRGLQRRNSANGNTTLNEQDYAVLLLVGSSGLTKPTDAQLHGARDAIDYCRREGPAGLWLGGHRDGYATACPGEAIYAWVRAGAPRPTTEEDGMALTDAEIKKIVDGVYEAVCFRDGRIKAPNPRAKNRFWMASSYWRDTYMSVRRIETAVKELLAQGAARDAVLARLMEGGGLDAAEIQAAAEAGAQAALDRLADALTEALPEE